MATTCGYEDDEKRGRHFGEEKGPKKKVPKDVAQEGEAKVE